MKDQTNKYRLRLIMAIVLRFNKIKSINQSHSSYGLKHIIEIELSHRSKGFWRYCSEDEAKEAMLKAGFSMTLVGRRYKFNVSEASIKAIKHLAPYPVSNLKPRYLKRRTPITLTELEAITLYD